MKNLTFDMIAFALGVTVFTVTMILTVYNMWIGNYYMSF
jgi:hypothetical protein